MDTVIITGGTGLIGTALSNYLVSRGMQVIILTRDPRSHRSASPGISYAAWNIDEQSANEEAFKKAKYVIHLAGAGVADKPWTAGRKKEIVESRTKSSALLVRVLKNIPNNIGSVVSASAIGWYKENQAVPAVETDPPDGGFLGETCRVWENSIQPVTGLGKRLVILRTGIVLSNQGGAFPAFSKPVRFGIAGILGNGKQMISWIHIEDMCRLYMEAMINPGWNGIYNAVAPTPVSNRTFTLELAKKMKGSFYLPLPVPDFLLRLLLGARSEEVLKSSNISSNKLKQQGFQFIFPAIDGAFRDLIHTA
jgi:uncharacterized protein